MDVLSPCSWLCELNVKRMCLVRRDRRSWLCELKVIRMYLARNRGYGSKKDLLSL